MTDDILDSVVFVIVIIITGVVLIILGVALQSFLLALFGGFFVGAIPILKIVQMILEK